MLKNPFKKYAIAYNVQIKSFFRYRYSDMLHMVYVYGI